MLWAAAYWRTTSSWFSGEYCWCAVDMRTYWAARDGAGVVADAEASSMMVTIQPPAFARPLVEIAATHVVGNWGIFRDKSAKKLAEVWGLESASGTPIP